jgi:hypothetical protein
MRIGAIVALGLVLLITARVAHGQEAVSPLMTGQAFLTVGSGGGDPLQPVVFLSYSSDQDPSAITSTNQPPASLSEGSFLSHRSGRFTPSGDGQGWQFTPDAIPAGTGASTISLTVLPNRQLSAMEDSVRQQSATMSSAAPSDVEARFSVTGLVTRYKNQNYLLVDTAAMPNADGAVLAAEKVQPSPAAPATQPAAPLPADKMLDQMLKSSSSAPRPLRPTSAPAPDRTSGSAAVAPGAASLQVMREGTFLVDRTGRLTRAPDGQAWEFSFDSDGRAMKDPPVIILPNLKLMAMEQAVKSSNRDLRFRITGMVTEYSGRNYVLLEKVVVVPEVTQQF